MRVLKLICALTLAAGSVSPVHAQASPLAALKPFAPRLTINDQENVCDPFLKAWTDVFRSPDGISEGAIEPLTIYPDARITTLPRDGRGFYSIAHQMRIDFDHDGDLEVLHFDSYDVGWRYLGVELYLFDSEKDFALASASTAHQRNGRLSLDDNDAPIPGASYRNIFSYAPIGKATIIEMAGHVYTIVAPNGRPYAFNDTEALSTQLVQLDAPDKPKVVCSVDILPAKAAFASFRDYSPLFLAARDIYAGDVPGCHGTMGWTAPPLDVTLPTTLFRPWAMRLPPAPVTKKDRDAWAQMDAARELRYLTWAVSDPQSWRDYTELKASRPQFISDMRAYYANGYATSEDEAQRMAEWAWRGVLDNLIYARGPDGYGLREVAFARGADLGITPDQSPADIVRRSVAAWRQIRETRPATNQLDWQGWEEGLLAAVYTRQPMDVIRDLSARNGIRRALETSGIDSTWPPGARYDTVRAELLKKLLIASLGHSGLTNYFLERGVDPNASTNDFGKTALMYAAQHDLANAVSLLIANKVDPNIKTQSPKFGCVRLERDNRTALMYAAENASAEVIDMLVAAGADVSAKDSQGNSSAWYFNRNTKVSDQAIRAHVASRLGG